MGRPPKPENLRRTKMVMMRLTQDEWNYLLQISTEFGMSVSDIFRNGAALFIKERNKDGPPQSKEKKK